MRTTQIPATMADGKGVLTGIDALLKSKEWERAAIVFAFTYDTGGGRPKSGKNLPLLTISDFADLGIAGLASRPTVRQYRQEWIAHGDTSIKPGDTVTLPSIDFPSQDRNKGTRTPKTAKGLAGVIGQLDPETKREFAIEMAQDSVVRNEVVGEASRQFEKKRKEARREHGPVKKVTTLLDGSVVVSSLGQAVNYLERAKKEIDESDPSEFTPQEKEVIGLTLDEVEVLITSIKAALTPEDWDAALHELKETG